MNHKMLDDELLKQLPNLYYERKKARGVTYVKTFDGNVWLKEKGYAIKSNTCTIGKIENGTGLGLIKFTKEFLSKNKQFSNIAIIRYENTDTQTFSLRVEHNLSSKTVRNQKASCSHDIKSVLSVGPYLVFKSLLKNDPLLNTLKKCFPDNYKEILSLAYFCILESNFKSNHYALFAEENKLPENSKLTPSNITRLFQSITEENELNFFKEYFDSLYSSKTICRRRFFALDSTSISTYADYYDACYGHNKQNEDIPQINVLMLTEQKSSRPLFYNRFNGSIPDISTVESTFKTLLHIGMHSFVAVMDRGYYSKDNLQSIIEDGYHFLVCVPTEKVTTYDDVINEATIAFVKGDKYEGAIDENVFTKKIKQSFKIKDKNVTLNLYVHVFYDQEVAAIATKRIQQRREEVIKLIKSKAKLDANSQIFANKYLIINKDTGDISVNNKAFQEANNKAGMFVLVSDTIHQGREAFYGYKDRQSVEDCFKDLKVKMNCDRFYTSSERSLIGKSFIEFIALSLYMMMTHKLRSFLEKGKDVPHHSIPSILQELKGIKEFTFADDYVVVKSLSKKQKECLKMFNVLEPTNRYKEDIAVPNMIRYARKPHGD